MKPRDNAFARSPAWVRGFRSRTAVLIAGLAISTCTAVRLDAVVIDDFAGPVKFLTGYFGTDFVAPSLTNGQLVLSGQFPGPLVPGNPYLNLDNIGWSNCFPAVSLEGRTLELRMDLVRASADDVFLVLAVETTWVGAGYTVMIDQNEVALFKYGGTVAALFWTDAAVTNQNVTVSLALKRLTNTMLVTTRVLDKGNGRTLFERSFVDTPGSDVGVPVPPPKGMTIFVADPGGPYTSFTTAWAGVWDLRTTTPPPLEVVLDNLEYDLYDVPSAEIAKSVLLSWSANTAEEQIVIGGDSLASSAVWSPWPEPIYKRFGKLCMTVPITASNWFGKLVPGSQFVDDFGDPTEPFATRNPWVPHFFAPADIPRISFTVTNGAFRIQTLSPLVDGRVVIAPPGTLSVFRDFTASVDILNFAANTNIGVGIYARGTILDPLPGSNGYIGQLRLDRIATWLGDHGVPVFFTYDPAAHYRLQFSAVGTNLTLRLVNLTTGQTIEQTLTDVTFSQGYVALTLPQMAPGQTFDITLDNFFVTGTK